MEHEETDHVSAANFDGERSRHGVENFCEIDMIISSFVYVGLSLNVDSSEYHRMKFRGKEPEKPTGFEY